ncbi:MAG: PEP-CTERM sorting domain-containing protein [Fimbriimonadaceae bacterium]
MKLAVLSLAIVTCAISSAQTFTNVSFSTTIPGASAAFVSSGNSFTANLTGFQISASQLTGDIAWIYDFNSNPVSAFNSVTIEIGGSTINGVVDFFGNEKVFDTSGTPFQVADGLVNGSGAGGGTFDDWVYTGTYTFSQPVTKGQVHKDILFADGFFGTGISEVRYIKQTFGAVPEPATMAALGLGVAALLRRRRR